jgi:hypothetical protein
MQQLTQQLYTYTAGHTCVYIVGIDNKHTLVFYIMNKQVHVYVHYISSSFQFSLTQYIYIGNKRNNV